MMASKEKQREQYEEHKEKRRAEARAYYHANKEAQLASAKAYRERNPSYMRDNYLANKEAKAAYGSAYQKKNKAARNATTRAYQAAKLKATPPWLTEEAFEEMELFYRAAEFLEEVTGESYEVDHIIPLRGKLVCGLHAPWNLDTVPMRVNRGKSNRLCLG